MSKLMQSPVFHELKKQASFFIKEKIKTARLAVTDVTEEELLVEEVTSNAYTSIDARSMAIITRASFEIDQFQRIVKILRQRMLMFDRREWRCMYNTLTMLNHLLVNGPLSVFKEFQHEITLIEEAVINIVWIDDKGLDYSLKVRKIAETVLTYLGDEMLLKETRESNRKQNIGRNIGFGNSSFIIHSETNKRSDQSLSLSDNKTCENDHSVDNNHPFVENYKHNTNLLLLSSST